MTTMSGVSSLSAADIVAARKVKIDRSNEVHVFKQGPVSPPAEQQSQEVQKTTSVENKESYVVHIGGADVPLYDGRKVAFSEATLANIEMYRQILNASSPQST